MPSGKPYFAHPTATVEGESEENGFCDPRVGAGTKIWHYAHVRKGAEIGEDCMLGHGVYVDATARIGRGCRLQNKVNAYDGVTLGDYVFCGPSMTFTNLSTPLPRAAISRREALQPTRVGRHASIGAGAVIVCGNDLGESCFVAGGAVVTRPVPAHAVVAGVPARHIGWACQCGGRLQLSGTTAVCNTPIVEGGDPCGRRYELVDGQTLVKVYDPHPDRVQAMLTRSPG